MKYSEFREYVTLNKIHLKEHKESLIAAHQFEISKTEEHKIIFLIDLVNFPYEFELIKKVIELAETPLSKRGEEKKYHLKHRFISDLTPENYINLTTDGVILSDRHEERFFKTKFTKEEIEELKEKFGTDLRDFEIIEVKED